MGDYIRIKNRNFKGNVPESDLASKVIDSAKGVKCVYSATKHKVKSYIFDETLWTEKEAQEWVDQHNDDSELKAIATIKRDEKGLLAIASDDVTDRDGEVISVDGWELDNYKGNPVLLWLHNRAVEANGGLPIGRAVKIGFRTIDGKKRLVFEPEFDASTEFNRAVKSMVENGLLNTFSVGFLPKERNGAMYTKQELLEISLVPVPANANAQFIRRAKEFGLEKEKAMEFVERKSTVAYRAYDPAEEGKAWDSGAAIARVKELVSEDDAIDYGKYKEAFAWYDDTKSDTQGSYKLPHHDVVGGQLVTVWRGVAAAMAALLGARGGVQVPDSDRKAIYNHLAKHYAQFDKQAPDFKLVESGELKELLDLEAEYAKSKGYGEMIQLVRSTRKFVKDIKHEKENQRKETINLEANAIQRISEAVAATLANVSSHKKGGK